MNDFKLAVNACAQREDSPDWIFISEYLKYKQFKNPSQQIFQCSVLKIFLKGFKLI